MVKINELQLDCLGELFNVGVGQAAASLSLIVNDEVKLSAPSISFVRPSEVGGILRGAEFDKLSLVTQDFSGPFDSKGMLIFPERNALVIVTKMLGDTISPEDLSEYEQETMCEVGNIILNACISSLANSFEGEFTGGLPLHQFSDSKSIVLFDDGEADGMVMVLTMTLTICQESIEGNILFLMSVTSMQALLDCVDGYLRRQGLV